MKEIMYNQKGEEVSKADLPEEIFGLEVNNDLVHQVVVAQMANSRKVIAHTKDRSERRGGGKKPWRQKGTGRARHGSIRSPIWRGGGVTFGPTKERNFSKKVNKKTKKKVLLMSLSSKVRDKEIVLIDNLELNEAKTKKITQVLGTLSKKLKKDLNKGTLIVLSKSDEKISRASRNIPKIKIVRADNLNILDVLSYKHLLISSPQDVIEVIKETYGLIR
ncbi:MAG: 50S ribosomal protein L4 [Candidatus Portnoybacteria bacterium]